ncbi:SDR family oxidoreductase [Sandarakinorhabdus sp. DWP1-3-1]|uniref:SDR family oxidoreductase n=1 Tax=Sandarakinorhabdus sp. DWP1-3-1 TaxID=2804627 RepID=UPI003CF2DDD5
MRILVTGAAGLVGGEVAARLAARGHAVTALVHRAAAIRGNDGAAVAVNCLSGDVTLPGFGLAALPRFDLIIHSAAITAFDAAPERYRAVNIGGVANAVALAEATATPLLHVSTAYVCGTSDGVVRETETGDDFVNGYEASKAAGEALVRAAMARGLVATISRPSIIVGDWASGRIRDFSNIYMIFRLIAEGRVRTLPGAPGASLDLVPIDHVCSSIVAMAEDMARVAGRTLHLTAATPTPLATLGAAIAAVPGLGAPHFVDPGDFVPAALPPVERRYHAAAASLYTSYLLRGPRFDTAGAAALLPPCPPTDRAWLDRLIGYCLDAGWVTSRPDRASRALSA